MTIHWNGLDNGLAQGFADLITSVVDPLPYDYNVQQGLRTIMQQNAAYALGRDAQGNIVDPSRVVTYARGGQSAHNYGLAVDLYPIVAGTVDYGFSGGSPEPTAEALPAWQSLWDAVRASGQLVTGADFQKFYDPGHVELANWKLHIPVTAPKDVTTVQPSGGGSSTEVLPPIIIDSSDDTSGDESGDVLDAQGAPVTDVTAGGIPWGALALGGFLLWVGWDSLFAKKES